MKERRGYCGIGIYHPKHACNQGGLWRSAYAFDADFVFTVGPRFKQEASDTPKCWRSVPMYRYLDLDDLTAHLPHACPLIGVELTDEAVDLKRFCHPERCVYLLGAEDHGLPKAVLQKCHRVLQVPGLRSCLNVATTGSLVLYDRHTKEKP